MVLLLNVLLDGLVRDVARTDAEVSTRPHVPPPELLPQVRKLTHHLVRCLPFQHLEQATDGHLRWNRDEQMHMIFRDVPFDNRDFLVTADFSNQLSQTGADLARHDWLAVLGDPDQMQVNAKNRVCAMPILCHGDELYHAPENLLKSSPKGEGFNPPRWGQ